LLLRQLRFAVDHPPLYLDRTPHRVDHAQEFRQEAVAGVLYDAAPVLRDLRLNELCKMGFDAFVRPLLFD
jgi:hypothetical protein